MTNYKKNEVLEAVGDSDTHPFPAFNKEAWWETYKALGYENSIFKTKEVKPLTRKSLDNLIIDVVNNGGDQGLLSLLIKDINSDEDVVTKLLEIAPKHAEIIDASKLERLQITLNPDTAEEFIKNDTASMRKQLVTFAVKKPQEFSELMQKLFPDLILEEDE